MAGRSVGRRKQPIRYLVINSIAHHVFFVKRKVVCGAGKRDATFFI